VAEALSAADEPQDSLRRWAWTCSRPSATPRSRYPARSSTVPDDTRWGPVNPGRYGPIAGTAAGRLGTW